MRAHEIMSANPACCTPDTPAREVARLMREWDCGCIPVVDDRGSNHLVGVVTDRDLAVRGLGHDRGPDTAVSEMMSTDVNYCSPDDRINDVERIMAEHQVRRVPVVDNDGACVGIIAQADLAREAEQNRLGEKEVVRVIERISEPADRRF
jgi:CBS domain-containing protein